MLSGVFVTSTGVDSITFSLVFRALRCRYGISFALPRRVKVVIQYLSTAASRAEDPQLAKLIIRGVAIHNSGLSPGDRGLVERAFLSGR